MNKVLQREEAIKRLEWLKANGMTYSPATTVFKKGEDVGIFENQGGPFDAVYYNLKLNTGDNDMYDKLNKVYEKLEGNENVVYLIQISHTEFGTLASFFYVSTEESEWKYDWEDLKHGEQLCYVANLDDEMCSEYGSIGFKFSRTMGGIVRTS
jgi:hypothetical protein